MREYPRVTGPPTYGASGKDIGPSEEETFVGFQRLINLRGARLEKRKIQRMRELGLL